MFLMLIRESSRICFASVLLSYVYHLCYKYFEASHVNKTETIHVRVSPDIKNEAESVGCSDDKKIRQEINRRDHSIPISYKE